MRLMMMHRTDAYWEAGGLPSRELIESMGKLIGDMHASGAMLAGEGLRPSSTGARLRFSGGAATVIPGPFTATDALMAGFVIYKARSLDEAIGWAKRYGEALGDDDVEIDIRPVNEPWDIGVCPRPEGLESTRFLLAYKAPERGGTGESLSPEVSARLAKLTDEMVKAGVFLSAERLEPTAKAQRLRFSGGKATVTDGPFAESKELIAGFVLMQVDSFAQARHWADGFAAVVGDVELDIRQVHES